MIPSKSLLFSDKALHDSINATSIGYTSPILRQSLYAPLLYNSIDHTRRLSSIKAKLSNYPYMKIRVPVTIIHIRNKKTHLFECKH